VSPELKDAITGTAAWEEDWSLDMTGNWTDYVQKTAGNTDLDQDRTQNEVNEITNITETAGTAWITPVQDKNGNMTTVPKPSSLSSGLICKYDAWNRLVEVKDGETVIGFYEYDGQNRRIKRHLDTDSPTDPDGLDTYVHYFYNTRWQTVETRDTTTESDQPENLQPKHQYIWSPRYIDSPILRDENTDQDSLCDDERLYYLGDANFNVTSLVDSSGDATERYVYDPYGRPTIYDATWSNTRSTSSYDNVVLYTGREQDPESGIMHYRNRYYSTELGRFVSRDPIGFRDSMNLVSYVRGAPTTSVDPSGLACTPFKITFGPTKTVARAGGIKTGPSYNPSIFGTEQAYWLMCARRRMVTVTYACTCWKWCYKTTVNRSVTYPQYSPGIILPLHPHSVTVLGPVIPIVPIKPAGVGIAWYGLKKDNQEWGDKQCVGNKAKGKFGPFPPFWPPKHKCP